MVVASSRVESVCYCHLLGSKGIDIATGHILCFCVQGTKTQIEDGGKFRSVSTEPALPTERPPIPRPLKGGFIARAL